MRIAQPDPSPRRLSVLALQGGALVYAVLLSALVMSWLTPPAYGDLSRLGRFAESAFGWQGRQPAVSAASLQPAPVGEADLLVIGDSFSTGRVWQSVLVDAGWRVTTWHWDHVQRLCDDVEPWLRRLGYRGSVVVLQVVERNLPALVDKSLDCHHMPAGLAPVAVPALPPPLTAPPPRTMNWQARLDTSAVTAWRTLRAADADDSIVVGDVQQVRLASVVRGCDLFTHRLCRRGLFLADDLDLTAVTPKHLAALPRIGASTSGLRVIWAVVPNKSTVYLQPERAAQLSEAMRVHLEAPVRAVDLYGGFMARRDALRDLYYPNDTHLSTAGYLAMGEIVAATLGPVPAR
jgi:hypothetical protein